MEVRDLILLRSTVYRRVGRNVNPFFFFETVIFVESPHSQNLSTFKGGLEKFTGPLNKLLTHEKYFVYYMSSIC